MTIGFEPTAEKAAAAERREPALKDALVVPQPLGNFALYATAPFFANPLKILWQLVEGKPYERSYAHF